MSKLVRTLVVAFAALQAFCQVVFDTLAAFPRWLIGQRLVAAFLALLLGLAIGVAL